MRKIGSTNATKLFKKEIAVGAVNGGQWAVVVTGIAGTLFQSASIGLLLDSAWGINLVCAAIAGASIPLMLQRIGIDPALAGGALLTIVTDVIWLYGVLGSGNPVFDVASKSVAKLKL